LEATDANFYGTTAGGGLNDEGTIFQVTPSGVVTTLHSFSGTDGADPYGALTQGHDGSFYGITVDGGVENHGTIFRMTTGGMVTTLHSFSGMDGASPFGRLIEGASGDFYGITGFGGPDFDPANNKFGYGVIFKITSAGDFTLLHPFALSDGANPFAGLTMADDGNLYGATETGGLNNKGVIFRLTADSEVVLHSFSGPDGDMATGLLVQGSDGN